MSGGQNKCTIFREPWLAAVIVASILSFNNCRLGRATRNQTPHFRIRPSHHDRLQNRPHRRPPIWSQANGGKDFLLGTGDRILVEASPVDPIWGIGLSAEDAEVTPPDKWPGENWLGFALMVVRDRIRNLSATTSI